MARLHRRYRKRKKSRSSEGGGSPRHNPPLITELAEWIGPGFGAFAVTRFTTRVLVTQIAKKKPSWGKHAGALAGVSAFLAAWLLAHRVKWLAKYQTPIAVGAAIAGIQSIIQLYIPKLGWIVSDASPELHAATAAAQVTGGAADIPDGMEVVDEDPSAYTYNDSYDPGRYAGGTQQTATPKANGAAAAASADDLMDLEMETDESQPMGIFGSNA